MASFTNYGIACIRVLFKSIKRFVIVQYIHTALNVCLKEADSLGHQSIAFPALGTGNLNYNPNVVANALFEAVERYNEQNHNPKLELVICVVYQDQMYQKFVAAARRRARLKGL
ncbi:hypothetical protein AM593_03572, partial [Mytilus galloprovincialis]